MKDKDAEFMYVVRDMVQRFADGEHHTISTFDLLRSKDLTMEKVYLLLVNQSDYQVMALMLRLMQRDESIANRIYRVIAEEVDKMDDEGLLRNT
jgi:hypothetical protein